MNDDGCKALIGAGWIASCASVVAGVRELRLFYAESAGGVDFDNVIRQNLESVLLPRNSGLRRADGAAGNLEYQTEHNVDGTGNVRDDLWWISHFQLIRDTVGARQVRHFAHIATCKCQTVYGTILNFFFFKNGKFYSEVMHS